MREEKNMIIITKLPKMILFDYGQTLVNEEKFDSIKGDEAVLKLAIKNPNQVSVSELQEKANSISKEIGNALGEENRSEQLLEIPAYTFDKYLYEYFGLEFDVSMDEVQYTFWKHATLGNSFPTNGIEELLDYLWEKGIRTAVVSNMMNSSKLLERRVNEILPNNHFEFFIASSDYVFRKPHKMLFELAIKKADILPKDIWFCGDNLLCDIEGSYNAGMTPIYYPAYIDCNYEADTNVPYIKIDSWKELMTLMEGSE